MEIRFEIPESKLSTVKNRVAKAAQRARKSGLPIPSIRSDETIEREHYVYDALAAVNGNTENTRRVVSRKAVVVLSNFTPDVGDFTFVGSRFYQQKDGEIIASNFGCIPAEIGEREKLCCDHCGYSRSRSFTWVLQNNKTGQNSETGSSCIEAFTGYRVGNSFHEGLHEVGKILHSIKQLADKDDAADELVFDEDVRLVLAVALRRVADFGFVSSADARSDGVEPTWRAVLSDLAKYRRQDLKEDEILVTEADFLAADALVEYFSLESSFEFQNAVRSATLKQFASIHDVALLTAGAKSYLEKLKRDQKAADVRTLVARSMPLGEKGERIRFVGKVYSVREYESRFGMISRITIMDADHNLLTWKASGTSKLDENHAYALKGTVKEHKLCERGYFEGLPETVLTRVSIEHELGPTTFEPDENTSTLSLEDDEALDSLLGL